MTTSKKLNEAALPLDAINFASAITTRYVGGSRDGTIHG